MHPKSLTLQDKKINETQLFCDIIGAISAQLQVPEKTIAKPNASRFMSHVDNKLHAVVIFNLQNTFNRTL